jgi:glycine betaine/proline transport system permease protein
VASIALFAASDRIPTLRSPGDDLVLPFAAWLNAAVAWLGHALQGFFRGISRVLEVPVVLLRDGLIWLPWPAAMLAATLLAWRIAGWRTSALVLAGLGYILVTGFWPATMPTLAIVAVAAPLSIAAGLLVGIVAHVSPRARRVIEPTLDLMQTMPTFAYLVPILVLFGLGPVVSIVASAIYAVPPMARATLLGLSRVPTEALEAARMAGSTGWQTLAWVKLPMSLPTLLLGMNQAVMAVLGMVVIAAILGGLPDVGWAVFNAMKKAQFGESILAGLVIALLAMMLDRVTRGLALRQPRSPAAAGRASLILLAGAGAVGLLVLLAQLVPALQAYPAGWAVRPAPALNAAVDWFTATFFPVTQAVKDWTVFYLLLPLKIGFAQSVRPASWGFEMSAAVAHVYIAATVIVAGVAAWSGGWRLAAGTVFGAALYYFGTTGLPWTVTVLLTATLAAELGGWRLGLLAAAGLCFAAFAGIWEQTMVTVQLCGAGVLVAFALGTLVGIAAGLDDRVSAVVRPVGETLQTMPVFVFLIPAIMVFLVGEFAAMVAIVLYAIVPAMRYAELGIRGVPETTLESARSMGATGWQLLRDVRLPLALPEIMMGLNQTIMMGLAMVIVAALAGARGLGQEIMIALTWLRVGEGLVAGVTVAIIAIVADRITQALSARKKRQLGLA